MPTSHTADPDPDPDAVALLRDALADPGTAWSLGSFGAVAEFLRDPDEVAEAPAGGRLGLATARGAIVLAPCAGLRPLAYETAMPSGWNHAVALCLPAEACAMGERGVVTELGPDDAAVRAEDRDAVLFDLGLGLHAVDACVRTRDPAAIAVLRAGLGQPLFASSNPIGPRLVAMSPHRVFVARLGRIEVFQPIPAPGGTSPDGPHTHVLPKLLAAKRTHAATAPIPAGVVPCAAFHPPHPYKDAMGRPIPFARACYEAFQALLRRWGEPELVALKERARRGEGEGATSGPKHHAQVRRVVAAQERMLAGLAIEAAGAAADAEVDDYPH